MCGIFASFRIEKRITSQIIKSLSLRGRDGYGIWSKKELIKKTENIKDNYNEYIKNKLIIVNSRAVPTTEVESGAGLGVENQQPFLNDQYVIVHNGIISNDKELIKEYDLKPVSSVDTAILPPLFTKVGVIEGLKLLKGSFAIICYDKENEKIYLAKNFMPMQFFKYGNGFVCTSLKEMIPEFLQENAIEVEPYTCYEIDLNNIDEIIKHSLYLKERNKKVLVICSGGIDSVTTAYLYKYVGYEVKLIHFTYGQAAQEAELFAIKKIAKDLKAELIVYDAQPVFNSFKSVSRLLNNAGASKSSQMLDAESTFSYVPNRNAIFAMIAGAVAETEDCDTLSFGGQQMDSVSGDTLFTVKNKDGLSQTLTIKEIEERKDEFINSNILSFNLKNYKIEEKKITKVWKHRVDKPLIKVKTRMGDSFKITDSHGIFILDKEKANIKCIDGKNLKIGDYIIMTPKQLLSKTNIKEKEVIIKYRNEYITTKVDINKSLLEYIGLWLADGCYNSNYSTGISINKKEFEKTWWNDFILENKTNQYRLTEIFGSFDVTIGDAKFQRKLQQLDINGHSDTKDIPQWIFECNEEQISSLLRGYFSGDGCISYNNRSPIIGASSVSYNLIFGIKRLLLKMGIPSVISFTKANTFIMNNKKYNSKKSYLLSIRGVEYIKIFKEKIGFLFKDKQFKLDKISDYQIQDHLKKIPITQYLLDIVKNDYKLFKQMPYLCNLYHQKGIGRKKLEDVNNLLKINKIEKFYKGDELLFIEVIDIEETKIEEFVYDFSVKDNQNFFNTEGILFHNSVYPDNNNTFVNGVDNLLKYSLNWNTNVKFTAPLINLIKHEIVELGMKIGVPYEDVCSCYYPKIVNDKIVPCKECGCCQFRHYAFKMIHVMDVQFEDEEFCDKDYSKIENVDEFIKDYVMGQL